jgi:uncharacterized protein (DUF433 family)
MSPNEGVIMGGSNTELFSPAEIGAVAGVPVKAVYKAIKERLPPGLMIRRNRQPLLTRWGAICVVIDHEMPKDVPVAVRKQVYAQVKASTRSRAVGAAHGIVRYVVDVKSTAARIDAELAQYRKAMKLIVEDPGVQAGAATFKGTRILVHQIADLIAQGATAAELGEDYPRLTREMIAAATIYARAHPRRGRPRKPPWRRNRPLSRRTFTRRVV